MSLSGGDIYYQNKAEKWDRWYGGRCSGEGFMVTRRPGEPSQWVTFEQDLQQVREQASWVAGKGGSGQRGEHVQRP